MVKKLAAVIAGAVILSGCSITLPKQVPGVSTGGGSIWKSFDGGKTFVPKIDIEGDKKITSADVVSFAFHPTDSQTIYMGTLGSGIFKTVDGGENWEQLQFPPTKNYGLAIDQSNGDRLYATGVFETISKMYRSNDAGKNWEEMYTEPGKGTVITALVSHPDAPNVLYAGTSTGTLIRSNDGGDTWKNLAGAKGPVTKILTERGRPDAVVALVLNQGVIATTDGGNTWIDNSKIDSMNQPVSVPAISAVETPTPLSPQSILTIAHDPSRPAVIYASVHTGGLYRSFDYGKNWESMKVIESAKQQPIRAIAVNPKDSNEISFTSGRAFYKSKDGGIEWATTQLEIERAVSIIEYSPDDPQIIYFTLRKY